MVKWLSVVEELRSRWRELATICGCSDDEAYQEISRISSEEICPPMNLSKCSSCMLRELLETKCLMQVPLSSATSTTMVYVLEDAVVEISDDCGSVAGMNCVNELLELLKDVGYDVNLLAEVVRNLEKQVKL